MAIIHQTPKSGGRPRHKDTILSSRPNRKPLSGARDVMTVTGVPRGLHARWVNDVRDRIQRFKEAGYEFLTDTGITVGETTIDQESAAEKGIGSIVSQRVGHDEGGPIYAYLMAIEEEFYEEDCKRKNQSIDRQEESLRQPKEGLYGSVQID